MKKKKLIKELEKTVKKHESYILQLSAVMSIGRDEIHDLRADIAGMRNFQNKHAERVEQLGKIVSDCLKEGENEREKFTEESPGILE